MCKEGMVDLDVHLNKACIAAVKHRQMIGLVDTVAKRAIELVEE